MRKQLEAVDMEVVDSASAAARRRQRRLGSWLRHERMSVAVALAESQHHASRGQKKARAGEEWHEQHYAPRRQKPPPLQPELFALYEEEPGGARRTPLVEVRPQGRVQRETV